MTRGEMYEALTHNDGNYDGLFFYGVKSTGIFCRPSCSSKKPLPDNVEYFRTAEEAMAAGYRPCKRCRSDLLAYHPMEDIAESVKNHLDRLYRQQFVWNRDLKNAGVSERRAVEIFKEAYGVTPKAYTNGLRLKAAQKMLRETDEKMLDIAMSVGFGSLSTFNRFFKEQTGLTPTEYRKKNREK
ncbi:MAG: bifunctional transcriptional activator/DNA repair enzyme AdaA [Anaerovoracaceae bacterium]